MAEPAPVEPGPDQIAELLARANGPDDGPLVMLNLNRYRDRQRYELYAAVAIEVLAEVGAELLWHADAEQVVVGGPDERYDEVIAVRYPSVAAFLEFASNPRIQAARADRVAALERATLIRCAPPESSEN